MPEDSFGVVYDKIEVCNLTNVELLLCKSQCRPMSAKFPAYNSSNGIRKYALFHPKCKYRCKFKIDEHMSECDEGCQKRTIKIHPRKGRTKTESIHSKVYLESLVLPVVVIEAIPTDLSFVSLVSANMHENGWAILVYGIRLFVWNYSQTSSVKTCYELQLPASDISHKADLVCLLFQNDKNTANSIPAVLSVSPEGTIRFWPKIANSNNNIEVIAHELQGQECNSLVNFKPFGCILSTTTNTLMRVNINFGGTSLNESNMITCKLSKIPQVSADCCSFFTPHRDRYMYFGSKSLVKILEGRKNSYHSEIIVFSVNVMRIFEISHNSNEMISEIDFHRLLKKEFIRFLGGVAHVDQLNFWIIDAKYNKLNDEIVLILAFMIKGSARAFYILTTLEHSLYRGKSIKKFGVKSMVPLKNYNKQDHNLYLKLRLFKENYLGMQYIYDNYQVICIREGEKVTEETEAYKSTDRILAVGVWNGRPIILTKSGFIEINTFKRLLYVQ